jgi:F0F1-type ATP synthase assembly protein I
MSIAAQLVLGAVVGVLAAVLLQQQIEDFLVRLVGRSRGMRSKRSGEVAGLWFSIFWIHGVDGTTKSVRSILRIRRIGGRITMTTLHGPSSYRATGEVKAGRHVTCTWTNQTGASSYSGSCQFVSSPEGDVLSGLWIGWNKDNHVSVGPWVLVAIDEDFEDSGLQELLAQLSTIAFPSITHDPNGAARRIAELTSSTVRRNAKTFRGSTWTEVLSDLDG